MIFQGNEPDRRLWRIQGSVCERSLREMQQAISWCWGRKLPALQADCNFRGTPNGIVGMHPVGFFGNQGRDVRLKSILRNCRVFCSHHLNLNQMLKTLFLHIGFRDHTIIRRYHKNCRRLSLCRIHPNTGHTANQTAHD